MKEKKYPTSLKPQENKTAAEWYGMILVKVNYLLNLVVCVMYYGSKMQRNIVAVFDHPVAIFMKQAKVAVGLLAQYRTKILILCLCLLWHTIQIPG